VALFFICMVARGATTALSGTRVPLIVGAVIGVYLLFAIKVADQWEKVAVLRLGCYTGLRGPGPVSPDSHC
jgi:regulator of protease activity HflC (stomatin/prohibitin superfamily)